MRTGRGPRRKILSDTKVLLINGSPNENGCTATALKEVADTLHSNGVETETLYLGKKPVPGCIACMKCFDTGHCFVTMP